MGIQEIKIISEKGCNKNMELEKLHNILNIKIIKLLNKIHQHLNMEYNIRNSIKIIFAIVII